MKKHVWFTRIVTIALCLCCLFACVCAEEEGAEATCAHSFVDGVCSKCKLVCGHTDGTTEAGTQSNTTYTFLNANQHRRTFDMSKTLSCKTCGVVVDTVSETGCYEDEEHILQSYNSTQKCKDCGYIVPCETHSYSSEPTSSKAGETTYSSTAQGHTSSFIRTDTYVCQSCGKVKTEDVTVTGQFSNHTWDNSTCSVCLYTCTPHDWSNKNGVCATCGYECSPHTSVGYDDESISGQKYVNITATTHCYQYELTKFSTCTTCGKIVSTAETVTDDAVNHSWDDGTCTACGYSCAHDWTNADGVCKTCGYTCTHVGTTMTSTEQPLSGSDRAVKADEKNHNIVYNYGTFQFCTVCHHEWNPQTTQTDVVVNTLPHAFDSNHTCTECGYTCTHSKFTDSKCDYCDYTCPGHVFDAATGTCKTCGMVCVHDWSNHGGTCSTCGKTCSHDWSNHDGTCSTCGKSCSHDWSNHDGTCSTCGKSCVHTGAENTKYSYADKGYEHDADTHALIMLKTGTYTCTTCGKEISSSEDYTASSGSHRWNSEAGTCDMCGYACAHPGKEDEKPCPKCGYGCEHSFTGGICNACGYACSHRWYTPEGSSDTKCAWCDLTCGHSEYGEVHSGYTTEYDQSATTAKTHTYASILNTEWQCTVCGYMWTTTKPGEPRTQSHDFNADGKCYSCGYQSTCAHKHLSSYREYDYDTVKVVSSNDTQHTITLDLVEFSTCTDCGIRLPEKVIQAARPVTEGHCYEDSLSTTCWACGYVRKQPTACTHSETEEYLYYMNTTYTYKDDKTHTVTGDLYKEIDCAICGDLIDYHILVEKNVSEDVPHLFSTAGVCDECGYVNTCTHPNREAWVCNDLSFNFQPVSDTQHSYQAYVVEMVTCPDCGHEISRTPTERLVTEYETHSFSDSGMCFDCGFKKPESTPTPTPTPTPKPEPEPDPEPDPTPKPLIKKPSVNNETDVLFVPTPEPTPELESQPMVQTLLAVAENSEQQGSQVTIEVVGAQQVMEEEEHTQLKALPVQEQILVTLASIGFDEVVDAAAASMNLTLSNDAQALREQITARMSSMDEAQSEALRQRMTEYFPVQEISSNGVTYSYFVLDLRIEVDGVVRIERYGFRLDGETGEWIFVALSTLDE